VIARTISRLIRSFGRKYDRFKIPNPLALRWYALSYDPLATARLGDSSCRNALFTSALRRPIRDHAIVVLVRRPTTPPARLPDCRMRPASPVSPPRLYHSLLAMGADRFIASRSGRGRGHLPGPQAPRWNHTATAPVVSRCAAGSTISRTYHNPKRSKSPEGTMALQGHLVFARVMPSSASAWRGRAAVRRQALARFCSPCRRWSAIATLRSAANTCGVLPARTWEWSSWKVTSRT
jgi:hypothetical protein